jgi:hypothetical protein
VSAILLSLCDRQPTITPSACCYCKNTNHICRNTPQNNMPRLAYCKEGCDKPKNCYHFSHFLGIAQLALDSQLHSDSLVSWNILHHLNGARPKSIKSDTLLTIVGHSIRSNIPQKDQTLNNRNAQLQI